jgi:hypothetical protein
MALLIDIPEIMLLVSNTLYNGTSFIKLNLKIVTEVCNYMPEGIKWQKYVT